MKIAAVNFADEKGWYAKGQPRLIASLYQHGFEGDYVAFQSVDQLSGCPTHQQVPYAFKLYAIREAKQRGYDIVFYGDASIYAVNSVRPILQHILEDGYYFETTEHNLGTWCSDAALAQFKLDRETAFTIPTIVAGCVGFDFRTPIARDVFDRWWAYANDGISFCGSWTNHHGEVSSDRRVKGHRHDQSAISAIARALQLHVLPFETHICYATPPPPHTIFHCHPT